MFWYTSDAEDEEMPSSEVAPIESMVDQFRRLQTPSLGAEIQQVVQEKCVSPVAGAAGENLWTQARSVSSAKSWMSQNFDMKCPTDVESNGSVSSVGEGDRSQTFDCDFRNEAPSRRNISIAGILQSNCYCRSMTSEVDRKHSRLSAGVKYTPEFEKKFQDYSTKKYFRNKKVHMITKFKSNTWLEKAGVLNKKGLTKDRANALFIKAAGTNIFMDIGSYVEYLHIISRRQKCYVDEIMKDLSVCASPVVPPMKKRKRAMTESRAHQRPQRTALRSVSMENDIKPFRNFLF